jgi:hypothetical protein
MAVVLLIYRFRLIDPVADLTFIGAGPQCAELDGGCKATDARARPPQGLFAASAIESYRFRTMPVWRNW